MTELDCGSGDIAKYTSGTWGCAEDIDTDTDTLADLDCDADEVAVSDGSNWSCDSPATANAGDIADAVESMFCTGEGEELTRSGSGALVCEVPVAWGTCPCVEGLGAWTQVQPRILTSIGAWVYHYQDAGDQLVRCELGTNNYKSFHIFPTPSGSQQAAADCIAGLTQANI